MMGGPISVCLVFLKKWQTKMLQAENKLMMDELDKLNKSIAGLGSDAIHTEDEVRL